jgi:uncharacterized protein YgiM (DUF1202 family)
MRRREMKNKLKAMIKLSLKKINGLGIPFSAKMIPGLIIFIMLFWTCPTGCWAATETLQVRVESGRVRESPAFDAPVEFGIKKGDVVRITKHAEDWYLIQKEDGRTGWAHQSLFYDPNVSSESFVSGASDNQTVKGDNSLEEPFVKKLKDIQINMPSQGEEKVLFVMNGFYPPEIFALEDTVPKVVCDFVGIHPGKKIEKRRQIEVKGLLIQRIRLGVYEGEKIRVVVDLSPTQDYNVEQLFLKEDNLYILTFRSTRKMSDVNEEAETDKKYGF